MLIKILFFIVALLVVGITLTLSLPEYKVELSPDNTASRYYVDQDALKNPYHMQDFFLITPTPPDAQFVLRLGLYSQLSQATMAASEISLPIETRIVKTIDNTNREWYLVLLGPYADATEAEQKKQWLQIKQMSAKLMLWPTANDDT